MKEKWTQTAKSSGKVLLFAVALLLCAVLAATLAGLLTGGSILDLLWRICSALGGIILLLAAVLLLTGSREKVTKFPRWTAAFPGLSFLGAVLVVGICLLLCAGVVNRLIWLG
jgi:MFS family permease